MTDDVEKFARFQLYRVSMRSISEILIQMTRENLAFSANLIDTVKNISHYYS